MVDKKAIYVKKGKKQFGGSVNESNAVGIAFNSTCCVCESPCYKTIAIICIYDESNVNYWPEENYYTNYYRQDLEAWNGYIENVLCTQDPDRLTIRMGLIIPVSEDYAWGIKSESYPFPADTTLGEIEHVYIGTKSPRVSIDDILAMFEKLKNGGEPPELLIFTLDNSGSIELWMYANELRDAKIELKQLYPNLVILDDISNQDERWLRDAYVGMTNRLCNNRCLCDICIDNRPTTITVWIPNTTPDITHPLYVSGPGNKSYVCTPYGLSGDVCRWRNISKSARIASWSTSWGYVWDYIDVNVYISKSIHPIGDDNVEYRYTKYVSLEVITDEPIPVKQFNWNYFFTLINQSKIDCSQVDFIPFVGPGDTGVIWTPS